nr:hypothetical protein [Tanacetum cinerariifolium]
MLAQGLIQQGEGSTVPVESQHTSSGDLTISQPLLSSPSRTKKVYSTAVIKLIMKVKRLEKIVKSSKARRRVKIVVSNDEDILEDYSKQGRMIEDIDQDARITLVTPKKVTRVHTYSRRRRTISTGSGKVSTASRIISTADETISTAGVLMQVSTAVMVQESTPSPRATKNK